MIKIYSNPQLFFQADSDRLTTDSAIQKATSDIINKVKLDGDAAIKHFTNRFDGVVLEDFRVRAEDIRRASQELNPATRKLFLQAIENVKQYHLRQLPQDWRFEQNGCSAGVRFTAIENVGVYIPGGRAGYPSTVIMTVTPAQIAGVPRIVLTSPPGKNGRVNALVLAIAGMLDVQEVYAIGGAHAVAALAYGTESIKSVDKIVGPGNSYVNEAKRQVFGLVGIDALAGPTELVVLADETANPEWIVRDMFAQAEHDPETSVICVVTSLELARKIVEKTGQLLHKCSRREILTESLHQHSAVIVADDLTQGIEVVNRVAPEHLEIMTSDPETILPDIRNAGAIFLGSYSPAVAGDYCGGPNHVLPTGRSARFSSPLGVNDFMKYSSVFAYSKTIFLQNAKLMAQFAELEGLLNHKEAMTCRS